MLLYATHSLVPFFAIVGGGVGGGTFSKQNTEILQQSGHNFKRAVTYSNKTLMVVMLPLTT